jgi:hypothetical protein
MWGEIFQIATRFGKSGYNGAPFLFFAARCGRALSLQLLLR